MEIGKSLDFKDQNVRSEFNNYSEGKLIKCWKCPKCGHSETIYAQIIL